MMVCWLSHKHSTHNPLTQMHRISVHFFLLVLMHIRKRILRRFQRLLRKSGLITHKDNLKPPESLKMPLSLILGKYTHSHLHIHAHTRTHIIIIILLLLYPKPKITFNCIHLVFSAL